MAWRRRVTSRRAGSDVIVLEARDRPGGRVEQVMLPDGRTAQAGGEVFGPGHHAYRELVEELGLTIEPSYVADPGEMTWGLRRGSARRRRAAVDERRASMPTRSGSSASSRGWPRRSTPTTRGRTPTPTSWIGSASERGCAQSGRCPPCAGATSSRRCRCRATRPERTSLLADLRKHAALGGDDFYDLEQWEGLRVAEGSAAVALTMAAELGDRVRLGAVVRRIAVAPGRVRVTLVDGELIEAEAVVCAVPAGPLRELQISGVSDARLRSLGAQRHALAAKVVVAYDEPFWQETGQNGLAETEWLFGSTWPQGPGVLSMLVPPERFSAFMAAPRAARGEAVLDGLVALYGERARAPAAMLERAWGVDPFTLGYITSWAPGRRRPGGAAARHPRAAVLRRRLRPLGGRLHGGRGPDRPARRGARRRCGAGSPV